MAPTLHLARARNGVERVRDELLTALHFGKLTPGDRVPSVRRLAGLTGLNRKTIHRAYTRLASEGLLDLRPGSGTFIAEKLDGVTSAPSATDLLVAANRCRATADTLGLRPAVFGAFLNILMGGGLRGLPLLVAECNQEQLGLIADELRLVLGVDPRTVLLSTLKARPRSALADCRGIVTTDCHSSEVAQIAAPLDVPVYRVALDPVFPQRLLDQARRGPVVMVCRDASFAPVFLRLIDQMAATPELARRFRIVEPQDARAAVSELDDTGALYVSPLVEWNGPQLPEPYRRLRLRWHLEPGSIDRLRASLALDLANCSPGA